MTKTLVIVESPTKSKTIEKFLGKNYTVKASMGHLRDLPKSTMGVILPDDADCTSPELAFEPKYINIRGKGELIKELREQAKKADKVYLATDPDREGEAISWHLAHLLNIEPESACRVEFHEITKAVVTEAIKKPRSIDMAMVEAQQARRILDRVVGYKLSPLLCTKFHRKGLSAGRVQSVATKLVADRDAEIEAFVPEEYWTLKAKLREQPKAPIFEAEVVKYQGKKLELHNEEQARAAEAVLSKAAYVVSKTERKDRLRHALPPLTTSSLQQEANKKLNLSARRTMMLAQQLYEGVSLGKGSVGLITYMRTDSVRLSEVALAEIRSYIQTNMGSEYCPAKPNYYSTKKNAQDAHEAIRPTSVERTPEAVAPYLDRDQLRLYTLIWQRTVASQMTPAVFDQLLLTIDADAYQLRARGSVMKFAGFLQLLGKTLDEDKDSLVPYIAEGTQLCLHKLLPAEQHFTEPPAHYTEASLIKELEEKGIGRPSTYAPTLVTIMARGYVAKEQKKLLITELGQQTVAMLAEYFKDLISIPFTAGMEEKLDLIAEQQATRKEALQEFYAPFQADLQRAREDCPDVPYVPEQTDILCDKCHEHYMVIREGRFGRFLACPGFPNCRNTKPLLVKIGVQCPICREKGLDHELIERKTKQGKFMYGCEGYPDCNFLSWDKPLEESCPVCGWPLIEHRERSGLKKYCTHEGCVNYKASIMPQGTAEAKAARAAKPAPKKTGGRTTKAATAKKGTAKK